MAPPIFSIDDGGDSLPETRTNQFGDASVQNGPMLTESHLLTAGEQGLAMPVGQKQRSSDVSPELQPPVRAEERESHQSFPFNIFPFSDPAMSVSGLEEGIESLSVSPQNGVSNNPVESNAPLNAPQPETPPAAKRTNAKDALHKHYDKKDYSLKKKNKNFVAFRERTDQDHIPRWTCIFVAPEGWLIKAGKLLICDESMYKQSDGMHWYGTKQEAMCAAAGQAIDYFKFRTRGQDALSPRHCQEVPVWPIPSISSDEDEPSVIAQLENIYPEALVTINELMASFLS